MHIKNQHGITLIELVVTMAILAVLAGVAIPAYKGYIKTSHETECQNEVAAIRLGEEEFFLDNNSYFSGVGASTLENASNNTYQASSKAKSAKSECDYSVVTTLAPPTYDIKAKGKAGNHLAGIDPVVELSGP